MNRRSFCSNLTARSAALARALVALPTRPATLPLLATVLATLAVAAAMFAIYVYPAHAQEGSAPDKPTGLEATASHGQVVLNWDNPEDDSITGYVILRRVRVNDQGGEFSELVADTGSAATTYTDDTVAASTTYTYRIKAINEHGTSERSRWYHIDTPAPPVPDQPTGLEATASHDSITLTWEDPQDESITGYVILRRNRDTDAKGHFDELAADTGSAATTYTDNSVAAETRYTYRIKAINEHGVSERSRWYHIDTPAAPEPETDPADLAPANLAAALTDGQVVLSWDAPAEAAGSVTGYEILRGEGADEPATLTADTGSAATTYTDATATTASADYAYSVKAIRDGERSQASGEAVVQLPPAVPTGVLSTAAHDYVRLRWNDPQDGAITGYRVLRSDVVDGAPGEFVAVASDTGSADTGYTDTTMEAERSYVYRVHAIGPGGLSGPSPDLTVNTPPAPITVVVTPADPQAPSNLAAELADGQVVLSWDPPAEDADTVTGYEILRAEGQGELSTLVSDTGNTATTYTDATVASSGASYAYRVKAIRDEERSAASNETWVLLKPAIPTGMTAGTVAHNSVTLTWDEPNDDSITGYAVVRWTLGYNATGFVTIAADTGTADPSYTDETVEPENEYLYHVRAINTQGESKQSEWLRVHTPAAPDGQPPAAPQQVLNGAGHDMVLLFWLDPQDDSITGYRILRADVVDGVQGEFAILIEDTGNADTSYTDETVEAETSYVYRVLAINPDGVSEPSSDVEVRTNAPVGPEEPLRAEPANVSEPSDGDCASNTATTCEVDIGGSATGTLDPGDRDWFKLELEAGTRYQIDLEGADTGRGTLPDPSAIFIDAMGNSVMVGGLSVGDDNSGVGENSRTIFTPTEGGTYFVQSRSSGSGTYTLSVIVLGANGASEADTDFPETTSTTGRVEIGASATGNIGTLNDVDWFKVVLEAGKTYQIDMKGVDGGGGTLEDPYLDNIRDSSGSAIDGTDNDDVDPDNDIYDSQIIFTPTTAGAYYLVASHATTDTGTYTLSVRDITSSDDSVNVSEGVAVLLSNLGQATDTNSWAGIETYDSAQGFTTGRARNGYFLDSITLDVKTVPKTPADVTVELWFASSGNPDASIATLTHATGTWATGLNTFRAPPGKVLAAETKYFVVVSYSGDRPGLDLESTRTRSADDTSTNWTVTGKRLERRRGTSGSWAGVAITQYLKFSVSAAEVPPPDDSANVSEGDTDLPADTTTSGRVQVGGSVTGEIDSETDNDWFKVVLEAGKTYQFDMEGKSHKRGIPTDPIRGTLTDTFLLLYNGSGTIITSNDDRYNGDIHLSFNSRIIHTATAAGAHYLEARGSVGRMGTYTLSAREVRQADRVTPPDDPGQPADDPNRPRVTLHLSNDNPFEGSPRVTVTATVSPASSVPFTVEVSATPASPDGDFGDFYGPAQEDDFSLSSNRTLSFAANATESSGTVTIRTIADSPAEPDVPEPHERVTVSGVVSREGVTDPDDITLTIINDDREPFDIWVSVPATVNEDAGTATVTYTLRTRQNGPPVIGSENMIYVLEREGTATRDDDYTRPDGKPIGNVDVFFDAVPASAFSPSPTRAVWEAERTFTIGIVDDTEEEPNETIVFRVRAGSSRYQSIKRTITILDDDTTPTVAIRAVNRDTIEGGDAKFTLARTGSRQDSLIVSVTISEEDDRDLLASGVQTEQFISIRQDEAKATFTLDVRDNVSGSRDGDITVEIAQTSVSQYEIGSPSSATVTVEQATHSHPRFSHSHSHYRGGYYDQIYPYHSHGSHTHGDTGNRHSETMLLLGVLPDLLDGVEAGQHVHHEEDSGYVYQGPNLRNHDDIYHVHECRSVTRACHDAEDWESGTYGGVLPREVYHRHDNAEPGHGYKWPDLRANGNRPAEGHVYIGGVWRVQVGDTITADTWRVSDPDGMSNATLRYQWLADYEEIQGATGVSYTVTNDVVGKKLRVMVTFDDDAAGYHEEVLRSRATLQVKPAPEE